jgi:hypothetical protein
VGERKGAIARVLVVGAVVAGMVTAVSGTVASASVRETRRPVPHVVAIVPSPNRGNGINQLYGVSCVTVHFCEAVGYSNRPSGSGTRTLIEKWNGTNWSISTSPNTGDGPILSAVSCIKRVGTSRKFCMAVGSDYNLNTSMDQTLIEKFNGATWSISPSPATSPSEVDLWGVSCASVTFCEAVGDTGNPSQTLIETWNGISWSVTTSPNLTTQDDQLTAVSCTGPTFCEAVGDGWGSPGPAQAIVIENWNGTSWTISPSTSPGSVPGLGGVSCTSLTFCDAVGQYWNGSASATLVETWNGTSWSVVASPNQGTYGSQLNGVSCTSPTFCEGAEDYGTSSTSVPLIETWNGTSWTIDPSLSQGTESQLNGVSCTSIIFCEAAGAYDQSIHLYRTLIESGP